MKLNEYQDSAMEFAIYCPDDAILYPTLGLAEEAGEVAGKVAKSVRSGDPIDLEAVIKELGDVLWMTQALASGLGYTLEEVAEKNIEKLESRRSRGVLGGSGDNR